MVYYVGFKVKQSSRTPTEKSSAPELPPAHRRHVHSSSFPSLHCRLPDRHFFFSTVISPFLRVIVSNRRDSCRSFSYRSVDNPSSGSPTRPLRSVARSSGAATILHGRHPVSSGPSIYETCSARPRRGGLGWLSRPRGSSKSRRVGFARFPSALKGPPAE